MMDELWGDFLPVPETQLDILQDGEVVNIDGLSFQAIETLGHANHHFAYIYESTCFSGDIGGVRMPGVDYIRLPVPPPEFNLEQWRESQRLLLGLHKTGSIRESPRPIFPFSTMLAGTWKNWEGLSMTLNVG